MQQSAVPDCISLPRLQNVPSVLQSDQQKTSQKCWGSGARSSLGLGVLFWVWFFFLIFENQGMLICRLTSDLSAVGRHPALYAECRFGA